MEEKKENGKFKYEKPELVDMLRAGAEGQYQNDNCSTFGSGASIECYDGGSPGELCSAGTGEVND